MPRPPDGGAYVSIGPPLPGESTAPRLDADLARRWGRDLGPEPERSWDWCERNVEKRLESWNILATISGFLAAFVISSLLSVESDDWPEDKTPFLAVHTLCLSFSASALIMATTLLSAVMWNIARELSADYYRWYARGRYQGLENFKVGFGAWRRLKLFTEESFLPLRVNAVNMSGQCFLAGTSSYFIAIACKLIAFVEEVWIWVPCITMLMASVIFALSCVVKMGVKLS